MKKAFILIMVLSVAFAYLAFLPISEEQAFARAENELTYYCADMGIQCSRFHSPVLSRESDGVRVFVWQDNGDPGKITEVRVPYKRIGDLTFGLIGQNVTLGGFSQ